MKRKSRTFQKNLDLLTPKQLAKYEESLDVLSMVRAGTSFSKSSKIVAISPPTVKKFLGSTLVRKNNRIAARKNDKLIRKLRIYENGKEVFIQVRGNKKSKRIGQYHSAVGRDIDLKKSKALDEFQNEEILDIFRKSHEFETDLDELRDIFQRRENPEQFQIYKSR